MASSPNIAPFDQVLAAFRAGRMVIMVDDAKRENEGDLVIAAERVTANDLAFMMQYGRGLICVSVAVELAEQLNLPLQAVNNNSAFNTPFTVSIDHKDVCPHGITAESRAFTIRKLLADGVLESDFVSPGSVYPLVANPAGVMARQGQTEGSYDLARIAGFKPAGVICEILNPDGTMARGAELNQYAAEHDLLITSVEEIIKYRAERDTLVRKTAESQMQTDFGDFAVHVFQDDVYGKEHLALSYGDLSGTESPLVRIHSECLTGDVFESRRCDCGLQLDTAMREIVEDGQGLLIYLRQEGRGIGLTNKLRAYALQDEGDDTVEANVKLGFAPDERNFAVAAKIIDHFKLSKLRLMTNNPRKIESLEAFGINISERKPLIAKPDQYSSHYLATKRDKLGHLL